MKQVEHTATKRADVISPFSLLNPCLHPLCRSPGCKESQHSSVSQVCFVLHFNWYGFMWNSEDSTRVIQGDRKDVTTAAWGEDPSLQWTEDGWVKLTALRGKKVLGFLSTGTASPSLWINIYIWKSRDISN